MEKSLHTVFFIYKVRKRPQGMLKEKVESDEELVH